MPDKGKILVVDDDPLVLRTISRILNFQGYQTVPVHSGRQAVDTAQKENFNLVLSDIRMPEMSGLEAVEKIETYYRSQNHPCRFIFMTGFAEEMDKRGAITLVGVAEFMMKPFDADKLLNAIEREMDLMREKSKSVPQGE